MTSEVQVLTVVHVPRWAIAVGRFIQWLGARRLAREFIVRVMCDRVERRAVEVHP